MCHCDGHARTDLWVTDLWVWSLHNKTSDYIYIRTFFFRMRNCCEALPTDKACVRTSDQKIFDLPRKHSLQSCQRGVRGFTKRSSCAPYKDCTTATVPEKTKRTHTRSKSHRRKVRTPRKHNKSQRLPPTTNTNMVGTRMRVCSTTPATGFTRSGKCEPHPQDNGRHTVCAQMDPSFLAFTKARGNDLSRVVGEFDRWCLCEDRWKEAYEANKAPCVLPEATHTTVRKEIQTRILEHNRSRCHVQR